MGSPIKIKVKIEDGVAKVKALMPHQMESGMRLNPETGVPFPKHFIAEVTCKHNDETVMTAFWGTAVSKNPYLSFEFDGAVAGDTVSISWLDNTGDTSEITETL